MLSGGEKKVIFATAQVVKHRHKGWNFEDDDVTLQHKLIALWLLWTFDSATKRAKVFC